jgi:hypothetical protein
LTVETRAPLDFRQIVRGAWRIYTSNFATMFLLAATVIPLQVLSGVIQDGIADDETASLASAPIDVLSALVAVIAIGALIVATAEALSGRRPEFGASLDAALSRTWDLITTNLLTSVLVVASIVAFPYTAVRYIRDVAARGGSNRPLMYIGVIVGAIFYFAIRWTFSAQAVMIEGKRRWSALDASAAASDGSWWRVVGVMLAVTLVASVPVALTSAATALPALPRATILSATFALVLPFIIAGQTLLYIDLVNRKRTDDRTD